MITTCAIKILVTSGFVLLSTCNASIQPKSQKMSALDLYNTSTLVLSASPYGITNRLVKRNASGNTATHTITCTNMTLGSSQARGTLTLTGTGSVIYLGSNSFLHAQGADNLNTNFFAGLGTGSLIDGGIIGTDNTAIGIEALRDLTSGTKNTAIGDALVLNNSDHRNTAAGTAVLLSTNGSDNTAVGYRILYNTNTGTGNVALGKDALANFSDSFTSSNNVAIGHASALACRLGSNHTALGNETLTNLTTGNTTIALGMQAGNQLISGNNNIYIGNGGAATEAQTIRLGLTSTHTNCFIAGIATTVLASGSPVGVSSSDNLQLGILGGTAYNLGNLIVKRNSRGDFALHTLTCTNMTLGSSQARGTLTLTGTGSVLYIGTGMTSKVLMHAQGNTANNNLFAGTNAGATNVDSGTLSGAHNTAVGTSALNALAAGNQNTALGSTTLNVNTSGNYNTAVGYSALKNTLDVNNNTGIGYLTLTANTTGTGNVGMGINTLTASTTATNNVALGSSSGLACRKGSNNTALGNESLVNLTLGNNTIAVGMQAGNHVTTGSNNIYIGNGGAATEKQTIRLGTTNTHTSCTIASIATTNLPTNTFVRITVTDQLGSTVIADLVGTPDNIGDRLVKRNSSGNFDTHTLNSTNITLGSSQTRGTLTLTDTSCMILITTIPDTFIHAQGTDNANSNFYAGHYAGGTDINTIITGVDNVALGLGVLNALSSGNQNTVAGSWALVNNSNANHNTCMGSQALWYTNGNDNTAIGLAALTVNTTGTGNVSMGVNALSTSTTATNNVAIGSQSGIVCRLGSNNTTLGNESLVNLTLGNNTIAVGMQAGDHLTTGASNIYIGNHGATSEAQTIRLGTTSTHTSCFIAGINGATSASGIAVLVNSNGQLGTTTSSRKFKTAITDLTPELINQVLKLHPVSFIYTPELDTTQTPQFGLIAEEVNELLPDLVIHDAQGNPYTIRYQFIEPLLLAIIQQQQQRILAINTLITQLQN